MQYAVRNHMAIMTFNIKDHVPLAIQYYEDGKEHYGVTLVHEGFDKKGVTE